MKEQADITAERIDDTELNRTVRVVRYQLKDHGENLTPRIARPEIAFDETTGVLSVYRSRI